MTSCPGDFTLGTMLRPVAGCSSFESGEDAWGSDMPAEELGDRDSSFTTRRVVHRLGPLGPGNNAGICLCGRYSCSRTMLELH